MIGMNFSTQLQFWVPKCYIKLVKQVLELAIIKLDPS